MTCQVEHCEGDISARGYCRRHYNQTTTMTRRTVCIEPGCPTITPTTRCPKHARQKDKQRGTTTQRGYGHQHRTIRKQWAPIVATGNTKCARCKKPINPTQAWDLGHNDNDRTQYTGPEHAHCNRATATHRTTPGGGTTPPPTGTAGEG